MSRLDVLHSRSSATSPSGGKTRTLPTGPHAAHHHHYHYHHQPPPPSPASPSPASPPPPPPPGIAFHTATRPVVKKKRKVQLSAGLNLTHVHIFDLSGRQETFWRWFLGLAAVPSVMVAVAYRLLPESPRFLHVMGRDEEAAQVCHADLGGAPGLFSAFFWFMPC